MAAPYYIMPDGTFPVQSGTPVLIDQAAFEACCCATYCKYVQTYRCVDLIGAWAFDSQNRCLNTGNTNTARSITISEGAGTFIFKRVNGGCWDNGNGEWQMHLATSQTDPGSGASYTGADFWLDGCSSTAEYTSCADGAAAANALPGHAKSFAGSSFTWYGWIHDTPCNDNANCNYSPSTGGPTIAVYKVLSYATYTEYVEKTFSVCTTIPRTPSTYPCSCSGTWQLHGSIVVTEEDSIGGDAGWSCP